MTALFGFFDGEYGPVMASVVAFVACFCIARLARARQGVALAFGFVPLLGMLAMGGAAAGGLV